MKSLDEVLDALWITSVPGSAAVVVRHHNGLALQERQLGLTLRDLQQLAAFVEAARLEESAERPQPSPALQEAIAKVNAAVNTLVREPRPCWCGHTEHVHAVSGGAPGCGLCDCHKYRAQRAKPPAPGVRSDDRRESDRHPPRPL